jgi:hypothetical protein
LAKLSQQGAGDVPQPASDAMPFDGGSHGLTHHQSDARRAGFVAVRSPAKMHDDVGLRQTNPVLHRRVKVN